VDDLVIRSATAEDVPEILRFIRELAKYERLADRVVASEDDLRTSLFSPQPAAHVVIADYREEPAGFALYFQNYSTFLAKPGIYLEDLFVRPHMRGKGIGRALLVHLARLVRDRGFGRLEWAVLDWNEPAIGFYRRLGAVPLDDWVGFRLAGKALDDLAE
jgi:GNAT superfamily N-acetyltransferase